MPRVRDEEVDAGASLSRAGRGRPGRPWGIAALALGCFALVAPALTPWRAAAQELPRIVIGEGAQSAAGTPLWIARDLGLFRKHGVDADLRQIRGGTLTTAALLGGEIAFASMSLAQVVGPVSRGADLVVVAGLVDKLPYRLVAAPSVRTPADLGGRTIGIATLSGAAYVAAQLALRRMGLDPVRDRVRLVQIGGEYERLAALEAGTIDAAMLAPAPAARLPVPSYRLLVDLRSSGIPWLHTSLVTKRSFVQSNPQLLDAVLRALVEGAAFALDRAHQSAVKAVIARRLQLTEPAAIEAAYQDVLDGIAWPPIPRLEAAASVLRLIGEFGLVEGAARLDPRAVMDPGPLLKLEREGFLDRLRTGR